VFLFSAVEHLRDPRSVGSARSASALMEAMIAAVVIGRCAQRSRGGSGGFQRRWRVAGRTRRKLSIVKLSIIT
jgi:hypothetical protein